MLFEVIDVKGLEIIYLRDCDFEEIIYLRDCDFEGLTTKTATFHKQRD